MTLKSLSCSLPYNSTLAMINGVVLAIIWRKHAFQSRRRVLWFRGGGALNNSASLNAFGAGFARMYCHVRYDLTWTECWYQPEHFHNTDVHWPRLASSKGSPPRPGSWYSCSGRGQLHREVSWTWRISSRHAPKAPVNHVQARGRL